ncbi:hypothetical protein M405DRAFT_827620, partial [Rhizopogon salebrosus TDB-379]
SRGYPLTIALVGVSPSNAHANGAFIPLSTQLVSVIIYLRHLHFFTGHARTANYRRNGYLPPFGSGTYGIQRSGKQLEIGGASVT